MTEANEQPEAVSKPLQDMGDIIINNLVDDKISLMDVWFILSYCMVQIQTRVEVELAADFQSRKASMQ